MLDDLENLTQPIPNWLREALAVPRESEHVEVGGCDIHYFAWGSVGHPGLLFVHGRMSHAHCWAFVAPFLAKRFRCVALDLSGMGDSGHRDEYAYDVRAHELVAIAEAAGLSSAAHKPLIVSHSYGAVVALNAMKLIDNPFAGLIACDPSLTHPDEWAEQAPRVDGPNLSRPHRNFSSLQEAVRRFRLAPPQESLMPVLEEYIAVHSIRESEEGWHWKFDPYVYSSKEEGHNDWWVSHTLDFLELATPKGIIMGANSAMINPGTADAVSALCEVWIPILEIPHAHHHLMVDQPVALAVAIQAMVQAIT